MTISDIINFLQNVDPLFLPHVTSITEIMK